MSVPTEPRRWTRQDYERAALEYWASLPEFHSMESEVQFTQRAITQESLKALGRRRPQVQLRLFGELLVQQFHEGNLVQVVPDTMVVLGNAPPGKRTSYEPEEEPPLFLAIEYVSHSNPYGDYVGKRETYEEKLRVPWYLIYDPEAAPLVICLYHHDGQQYQIVRANSAERFPIPDLELEVGMVGEWMRFWYQGELLPLPEDLDAALQAARNDKQSLQSELRQRDDQLNQLEHQLSVAVTLIRGLVENRARLAGRQDILAALPATTDLTTLQNWLAELG
jgi:Uma2 family endonuclease